MIIAQVLTDQQSDDASRLEPLLMQIEEEIAKVTADDAYDGAPTYQTIARRGSYIEVVIPPRKIAVSTTESSSPSQRDRYIEVINTEGRMAWQTATGYGQRALVETSMARYKCLIGPRLRSRGLAAQESRLPSGLLS